MDDPFLRVLLWLWVAACCLHTALAVAFGEPTPTLEVWWASALAATLIYTGKRKESQ